MRLKEFRASLAAELTALEGRYDVRRSEHPALAPYATVAELLTEAKLVKVNKKWVVSEEGKAIRCALLDLYQKTHDRLWVALILGVFRPMLTGIARTLYGGTVEEQESLLLASFHRAIERVPPYKAPDFLSVALYRKTRRHLFAALKKEIAWDEVGVGVDDDIEKLADPALVTNPRMPTEWTGARTLASGPRQALLETLSRRGALWDLVREEYGHLPQDEQQRVYRRLKQQRHRHVEVLRRKHQERDAAAVKPFKKAVGS